MKKIISILKGMIIISIITILTGCGIKGKVKGLFMSEFDKADFQCDSIVKALEKQDKDKLEQLFSKETLKNAVDFDDGCEYLFNEYTGEYKSKERVAYTSTDHLDKGKLSREVFAKYKVITTESKYMLYIYSCPKNSENVSERGIYKLIMLEFENEEDIGAISQYDCVGIYWPAWDDKGEEKD